jgi:hypothetical protein
VHRIVLPSGRKIEVVRFHDGRGHAPGRPLHICPECSSSLVQPQSWSEVDDNHWELLLLCPNCEWMAEGVYTQSEVEDLEDRLEDGLSDMLEDLQRLTRANMADEVDRFIAALDSDLILPEDF